MKKIVVAVLLVLASASAKAQMGVLTIKDKNGPVPVGQWYNFRDKEFENKIFYVEEKELIRSMLDKVLEQHEVVWEDQILLSDGNVQWVANSDAGFTTYITYETNVHPTMACIIIETDDPFGTK